MAQGTIVVGAGDPRRHPASIASARHRREHGRASPNGRPRHAFTRATRAAGLGEPVPRLHDLRHAYASALLAAGLTVHAVAELLGHASPALVMARHGHAYAEEKASSAMALERLVAASC
jgi:integrase